MPNWKEAFEEAVRYTDLTDCRRLNCEDCPLAYADPELCIDAELSDEVCISIYRHVLATVKDFTDRDEIRARIAEMLDDNAREKFLGKPEPEKEYSPYNTSGGITYRAPWGVDSHTPEFNFSIQDLAGHIAAFRDKETRDRVLEFLNADAAEDERIDRLLIQLKELLAKG